MSVDSSGPALVITDLRKAFRDFTLGPVTSTFRAGRIYGLLGPNGAGKTTLLNLLALQLRPSAGRIELDGRAAAWADTRWKSRVTYIRETPAFYDELTVKATMTLAGRLYDRFDAVKGESLLDRFQLASSKKVGTLSKGSKVKLGLAVALAHEASVLLLDEPTAGLDPTVRADLQDVIVEIVRGRSDVICLLSSHIFEDAERVADEALFLREGRFVFAMPLSDLGDLAVCRLNGAAPEIAAPGALSWTRRGERFALLRRDGEALRQLRHASACTVTDDRATLADVYAGTEGLR